MIASGITYGQLLTAAEQTGTTIESKCLNAKGTRHRVKVNPGKLLPNGDHAYQRTNPMRCNKRTGEPARVHAVCWHGFRDFFRACFRLAPDAVFSTAADTWRGSADFERRFRDSGYQNIGSQMYPVMRSEACRCGEEGYAG